MLTKVRELAPIAAAQALFFLPAQRRKRIERWLRGREEHRKLQAADCVVVSWGKSGRTWLRLMLSRAYQTMFQLGDAAFLEFDNLQKKNKNIPKIMFTHGNYLRDYTGHWDDKRDFRNKKVVLLIRDPRDVAVSQYFQWKYRMRPAKKFLNDYPPHGADISLFDFVFSAPAGLRQVIDFYNLWAEDLPRLENVLVVRYEEMRARPQAILAEVLAFIGTPADDDCVADAVSFAAYDNMKTLEQKRVFWLSGKRMVPGDRRNPDSYKVRRAKVGGYRDYFDDAQLQAIDALVERSLSKRFAYETVTPDRCSTPSHA